MHNPLNPADLYRRQEEDAKRWGAELEQIALERFAEHEERKEEDDDDSGSGNGRDSICTD